jgi:hypothetical protein
MPMAPKVIDTDNALRSAEFGHPAAAHFPAPLDFATVAVEREPRRHQGHEGAMPTVEVWVVLGEDGSCEAATDEDSPLNA